MTAKNSCPEVCWRSTCSHPVNFWTLHLVDWNDYPGERLRTARLVSLGTLILRTTKVSATLDFFTLMSNCENLVANRDRTSFKSRPQLKISI